MPDDDRPFGLFRKDHPETAREAAFTVDATTYRAQVYAFLRGRGDTGATDEEIQRGLGMNPNTERPRRVELVDAGRVRDSGQRRETTAGRKAIVWSACDG